MAGIDGQTIEGLRRGEEGAFTAVVDLLLGPIYRFLLRLSSNPGVAEDLTQETFLAVWQSIGSFGGKSQFRTWVFGIAYRQFLRYRDKRKVETVQLDETRREGDAVDPEVLLLESDQQQRARQAIYALPDPYREGFCLVHLEGLNYREAAEILGVPVGTVKSRMNVAFKLLREKLGGSEGEDNDVREAESISGR
jgi:RNA polymerase sigma-70 factor (ECF subfamily)